MSRDFLPTLIIALILRCVGYLTALGEFGTRMKAPDHPLLL